MLNNIGKVIDAKDVPRTKRKSKYREMFQSIPIGKAGVFTGDQVYLARMSLSVFKKRGEFSNYYAVQVDGTLYVANGRKRVVGAVDGYDLGIIIRLNRWNGLFRRRIMGELISEVGWLKGSEEEQELELDGRLKVLEKNDYIKACIIEGEDELFYVLTDKAYKTYQGLPREK